jgi:hypothetical protein
LGIKHSSPSLFFVLILVPDLRQGRGSRQKTVKEKESYQLVKILIMKKLIFGVILFEKVD